MRFPPFLRPLNWIIFGAQNLRLAHATTAPDSLRLRANISASIALYPALTTHRSVERENDRSSKDRSLVPQSPRDHAKGNQEADPHQGLPATAPCAQYGTRDFLPARCSNRVFKNAHFSPRFW